MQAEANSNDTWTIAKALFTWLKNNTVYYVTPGTTNSNRYQTAPQVLSTGRGQCVELSSLYISLLRSVGIPAREVSGYSLEGPSNSYLGHQWVEFYDGQWVPVEVSGSGVSMNYMLTYDFGFQTRNQIGTFVDDGSNNAALYDFVPIYFTFSPDAKIAAPMAYSSLYTNKPSNPRYIKTCMNGTISLVSAKN